MLHVWMNLPSLCLLTNHSHFVIPVKKMSGNHETSLIVTVAHAANIIKHNEKQINKANAKCFSFYIKTTYLCTLSIPVQFRENKDFSLSSFSQCDYSFQLRPNPSIIFTRLCKINKRWKRTVN